MSREQINNEIAGAFGLLPGFMNNVPDDRIGAEWELFKLVQGQVKSVSGDLVTDAPNTPPYYLVRVGVTPEGLRKLGPQRQLQPGMPAEVVVRTGERSLLTYLLHPLTKRIAASMKEE